MQGHTDVHTDGHTDGHTDMQTSSCIFESAAMWLGSALCWKRSPYSDKVLQSGDISKIGIIDNQLFTKKFAIADTLL